MLTIGKTDAFEQRYMTKFEQLAGSHGVLVRYDRDRAARDIGLHLTKDKKSGDKQVTNSRVWFQMKGVMATTLPKEKVQKMEEVSILLEVKHLRHWFLDKEPIQLVVYLESIDTFLVMNLKEYITRTWGHKILSLDQAKATVAVPVSSVLDEQAFAILLRYADISQWSAALNADYDDIVTLRRDYGLIYSIGTANQRGVEHSVHYTKWLSKMRDELNVAERPANFNGGIDDGWTVIHQHWQYGGINPEDSYPHLELFALEEYDPETFTNAWGEEELVDDGLTIRLKNGDRVFGPNAANEFCWFIFGARQNDYGKKLFGYVEALLKMGLLELNNVEATFLSIAPWHERHV